jgi:hypothetical protein
MPKPSERPIPDSYWVRPGRLLAGEYPGSRSDEKAQQKLRQLLEAGVTFFLDLTEVEEGLKPYVPLLQEEVAALGRSVAHPRMPIRDGGIPAYKEMAHILNTIDSALAEGHTIYVHCWGGKGRTGTVIGCYLVRHGMSGEEALDEISRLRQGTHDERDPSPETEVQRQTVRNWSMGR